MYCKAEEKTQKPTDLRRIAVLGVGNVLLEDEGVGIHIINALKDSLLPANVHLQIIDGGTSPNAFHLLERADKLIIIDAVRGGSGPGSVYRFRADDITPEDKNIVSLHQIGLFDNLEIMEYMGDRPKDVVIIGVEPKEMGWGLELSPELEIRVPHVVSIVLEEIMEESRKC